MDFKGKLVDKMDNGFCFITKSKKYHLLQKHILRVSCFYKNSLIFTLYTNISLEGLPKCCISVITETKLTKLGMDMDLPKGYMVIWRNEAVTSRQPCWRSKCAKIGSPKNGAIEAVLRS